MSYKDLRTKKQPAIGEQNFAISPPRHAGIGQDYMSAVKPSELPLPVLTHLNKFRYMDM